MISMNFSIHVYLLHFENCFNYLYTVGLNIFDFLDNDQMMRLNFPQYLVISVYYIMFTPKRYAIAFNFNQVLFYVVQARWQTGFIQY